MTIFCAQCGELTRALLVILYAWAMLFSMMYLEIKSLDRVNYPELRPAVVTILSVLWPIGIPVFLLRHRKSSH